MNLEDKTHQDGPTAAERCNPHRPTDLEYVQGPEAWAAYEAPFPPLDFGGEAEDKAFDLEYEQ